MSTRMPNCQLIIINPVFHPQNESIIIMKMHPLTGNQKLLCISHLKKKQLNVHI